MSVSLIERLRRLVHDESGPTAVEYAVMLALIIVVCLAAIRSVGTETSGSFQAPSKAMKIDGNQDGNGQW